MNNTQLSLLKELRDSVDIVRTNHAAAIDLFKFLTWIEETVYKDGLLNVEIEFENNEFYKSLYSTELQFYIKTFITTWVNFCDDPDVVLDLGYSMFSFIDDCGETSRKLNKYLLGVFVFVVCSMTKDQKKVYLYKALICD